MEPIRPDSDEVAARKGDGRKAAPRQTAAPDRPGAAGVRPPAGSGGSGADGNGAPRSSLVPLLLLAVVVLGGGWALFQQHQTINQLQSNLGEAEDWINRSKLSMARFEGRLSEADRELLESGSEITEKLKFLDSEMRKLWGVANDRNRKAIEANQKATEFLEKKTDYLDKQGAEQRELLASQTQKLEEAGARAQALQQELAALTERQQALASAVNASTEAANTLKTAQQEIQQQLNSFNQRQTLSLDEVRARVDAMEKRVAAASDQSAVKNLQNNLASLKEIVDSIDASRAQITGRLLQLEERLQAASGG